MSKRMYNILVSTRDPFTAIEKDIKHENCVMRMSTNGVLCIENRYGDQLHYYPEGEWIGAKAIY